MEYNETTLRNTIQALKQKALEAHAKNGCVCGVSVNLSDNVKLSQQPRLEKNPTDVHFNIWLFPGSLSFEINTKEYSLCFDNTGHGKDIIEKAYNRTYGQFYAELTEMLDNI
jgi:hypothetical protein